MYEKIGHLLPEPLKAHACTREAGWSRARRRADFRCSAPFMRLSLGVSLVGCLDNVRAFPPFFVDYADRALAFAYHR
jgi:hypothetical protein